MKRLSWFVGGALAGVAGAGYAKKKVKATASQLSPAHVAKSAMHRIRERGRDLSDAVHEGRVAMHSKEAELIARRDGTLATLADELEPNDRVLVDGQPVEPGQVIVLRQVRGAEQAGPRRNSRRMRRGV
jgi:hypothetical protein